MKGNIENNSKCKIRGLRYLFSVCSFLGVMVNYALRSNMSVAILAMVNSTAVYNMGDNNISHESHECKNMENMENNSSYFEKHTQDGPFIWSPRTQGHILGAFYYGYGITQIPGGRLSEIFSGKWVLGITTVITAITSFIIPTAARFNVGLLIALLVLQGLSQGVLCPSMHSMIGRWIPDAERGFLSAAIYCGLTCGSAVGMALTGVLCDSEFLGGWPSSFYATGTLGCIWFCLWSLIITDIPHTHPFITTGELMYISANKRIEKDIKLPPIPWRKIMTSAPFLALIINQFSCDWFFYIFLIDLPTYLTTILHFDIKKSGILSSVMYMLSPIFSVLIGYITDTLIRKGLATTKVVRMFCVSVVGFGPALMLLGLCLAGCSANWSIILIFCAKIFGSFYACACSLGHLDLCPEYAGTLMGIANTVGSTAGFLAPLMVGILTDEEQTLRRWYIVFGITVIIQFVGTIVYLLFGTTEKQDWLPEKHEELSLKDKPHNSFVQDDGEVGIPYK